MDREILFRGKRIDNGEWVYGYLFKPMLSPKRYFIITGDIDVDTGTTMWFEVVPATVGQYTGLTDKNGKKIFEGDIFKDTLGVISVVEWCDDGRFLGFAINTQKSCRWDNGRCITYIAREPSVNVIGNIHDNPELLEVQNGQNL